MILLAALAACSAALVLQAATGAKSAHKLHAAAITDFADEAALFAQSTFPIKPDALIQRAMQVVKDGIGTKDGGACLAESFEFCAAVVGPLGKTEYLEALGTFKLEESFDLSPNYHLFRCVL